MLQHIRKIFVLLFLTGCGSAHGSLGTTTSTEELQERYDSYHALAKRGWEIEESCDALLFVSLGHVGLVEPGPVEDAEQAPGRWSRLPGPEYAAECSSDISRDMFMGLFNYIWAFHRLDLAEQIWDYGQVHSWVMGAERHPPDSRTVLTPAMIGLLARMIHGLGGADHPERLIPSVYSTDPGFVSHLTLLSLTLEGSINGSLSEYQLDTLRAIRKHMGLNPLVHALIHRYTDGDQTEATRLLLTIWPAGRLPNMSDWTEAWRLQRSDGDPGLLPGQGDETHSGGDFLFPAALILGLI